MRIAVDERPVAEIGDQIIHAAALTHVTRPVCPLDAICRLIHRNQFFGRRRVHRHCSIKIILGQPRLERDTQNLSHFAGIRPHDMSAKHTPGLAVDNELHEHLLLPPGQRVAHGPEARAIDFQSVEALRGLVLGKPHRADFGLREHGRGNRVVIDFGRIALVFGLDKAHSLMDCDRRELHAIGHIPKCPDVIDIRARETVDRDFADLAGLHTGSLEPQTFGVRNAANSQHDLTGLKGGAGLEMNEKITLPALFHSRQDVLAQDPDALGLHRGVELTAQILIETRQDFLSAIDQRGVDTKAVEDIGELDGNIAATLNDDRRGQRLKVEGLVGKYAMLMAGKRQVRIGTATDSDDDPVGRHALSTNIERVTIHQRRAGLEYLGAGILKPLAIKALKPGNLTIFVRDESFPVEGGLGHGPAIAGCILEMLRKLRGVYKELLRHTAANDAGAAKAVFFGNGDAFSKACRKTRSTHPTRTAANHKKIVVEIAHSLILAP